MGFDDVLDYIDVASGAYGAYKGYSIGGPWGALAGFGVGSIGGEAIEDFAFDVFDVKREVDPGTGKPKDVGPLDPLADFGLDISGAMGSILKSVLTMIMNLVVTFIPLLLIAGVIWYFIKRVVGG